MGQLFLLLVVALTVGALVFGVTVLVTGRDPGLAPAEPDGRAVPLPGARPLRESDVGEVRFDTALRGYRMDQVDQAMRRTAYDLGFKSELIEVLEAEVTALRAGRVAEADRLRRTREQAATATAPEPTAPVAPDADAGDGAGASAGTGSAEVASTGSEADAETGAEVPTGAGPAASSPVGGTGPAGRPEPA